MLIEGKDIAELKGDIAIWEKEDTGECIHSKTWKTFYSCPLCKDTRRILSLGDLYRGVSVDISNYVYI